MKRVLMYFALALLAYWAFTIFLATGLALGPFIPIGMFGVMWLIVYANLGDIEERDRKKKHPDDPHFTL